MKRSLVYLRLLQALCLCSNAIVIKFECSQESIWIKCSTNGSSINLYDKNATFEMGNLSKAPQKVMIEAAKWEFIPPEMFREFSDLREVVATNISVKEIFFDTFADARKLHYLILSNNQIRTLIDKSFVNATSLQSLKLQHNQINSLSSLTFYGLTELRTLVLSFNLIENLPLYIFRDLTSLEFLYLDNNLIKVISFYQFTTNSEIECLYLEKNGVVTIDDGTFENLTKLRQINLMDNICVDENFSPWSAYNRTELNCCWETMGSLQDCLDEKHKKDEKDKKVDRDSFENHVPLILLLFLSIVVNFTVLSYCLIKRRRSNGDAENIELIIANDLNGSVYQVY